MKSWGLGGFSMYGAGMREKRQVEIEIPEDGIVKGDTYQDGDSTHQHEFTVEINDSGGIVKGYTDTINGHSHKISKGTATEESAGHKHRYSFIEALTNED